MLHEKARYLSVKEAAYILRLSQCRVYQFIEQGRLKAHKISGVYAIPEHELQKMMFKPRLPGRPKAIS